MPKYLLTLKYDGTNYCGWQVQKNGVTVQGVLCEALQRIFSDFNGVLGCSRTDSGVHANMYCCHFETSSAMPAEKIPAALNANLPLDISVVSCEIVDDDFHARYSCTAKNYIYKIYNSRVRDPFKEKYYLRYGNHIDENLLNQACSHFLGEHDFVGFSSSGSSVTDTVRTISECYVKRVGDDIIFSITGNGFLYNMVRIIVGTLLYVNEGKISPCEIEDIIYSKNRSRAGVTAKPHGLYLNKVFYSKGENNGII